MLTTHHHEDHCAGNQQLRADLGAELQVYGYRGDAQRIPALNCPLEDEQVVTLEPHSVAFRAMLTPPHTSGHLCYYFTESHEVFTGDCLFIAGSGYINEGTPAQMHESMQKLATLPDATRVWPGHEYTVANLKFVAEVADPQNADVHEKLKRMQSLQCTVPSTIAEELKTNPYMRVHQVAAQFSGETDVVKLTAAIRQAKNGWKPKK